MLTHMLTLQVTISYTDVDEKSWFASEPLFFEEILMCYLYM